jgi:uncharacterized protein (TIGR00645 family)
MTPRQIEQAIEKMMYASRWVLAPVYLGMSLALFALAIKFFQELFHFLPMILEFNESELILKLLTLIDLTLVGSLTIIVMFSGYENFVSRLDLDESTEKLDWLGSHDYGSLKMKVASSIVAISSIHLLKVFMNVQTTDNDKLMWYVLIHLTMVISALLMGYLDKISRYHIEN